MKAELEELRQQLTLAATRLDEERAAHEGDAAPGSRRRAPKRKGSRGRPTSGESAPRRPTGAQRVAREADEGRARNAGRDAARSAGPLLAREAELAVAPPSCEAALAAATNELDAVRAELAASEESRANDVENRAAVEAELEGSVSSSRCRTS